MRLPEPCSKEEPGKAAGQPDFGVEGVDPSEDSHRAQSCRAASFEQELNLEFEPVSWKGSRKHLDLNHLGHSFVGDLLGRGLGRLKSAFCGKGLCAPWARHKIG